MAVKPKPDGYHSVTPYLAVDGAARLIDFVKHAFKAEEVMRLGAPGDRIGHAEVRIGDTLVMVADAHDGRQPMQAMLHVYVSDADATYQRALKAGGSSVQAPEEGPGRQPVVDRDPYRGRVAGGTAPSCRGGDAESRRLGQFHPDRERSLDPVFRVIPGGAADPGPRPRCAAWVPALRCASAGMTMNAQSQ